MADAALAHATFTVERTYAATPARVFRAFSDQAAKALWFSGPDEWITQDNIFDFRPGGRERVVGVWPDGKKSAFDCLYYDIVQDRRIVYAYEMHVNDVRISVSLATVEIFPAGAGARLRVTEQGVHLDGRDGAASREHGTAWLLDKLGTSLTQDPA